jgi:NB-ARC domain/Rx N-terminal domain
MSLSSVVEWTGSAIISNLINTAYSYLGERLLPPDTESELRRLNAALPKISAVMGVAEALKFKYPNSGVNAWLEQFKQAFLEAEDVLDELSYRELEDMVKDPDQVSGSFSSTAGSLKRKFPGSNLNNDTCVRLKEVVKMLDLAATNVGHFIQFLTFLGGPFEQHFKADNVSSRETTSFLTESKVFGRKTEKAVIIEWLKKMESHARISAFCIVGAGGLGKTTLAQLIFEEISNENHFDEIVWICVSTSFSVQDITRNILNELGERSHDNESLNHLQVNLKKKIFSKKILFILDDVWNDEKMCDWQQLIAPFKSVKQGSKILLTTRMKSVAYMLARVLDVDQEYLALKGLEEQDLVLLLRKYAYHGYNPDNYINLKKIEIDIVKKLRGSPLAAKVIGGLLNSYMDFHYWKGILNCDSLMNLEQAKDVMDVLKLSYHHLSADVQECFRFCCIFPQDYKFKKNELIRMWIASGFVRKQSYPGNKLEDIGREYFNHLLRKSFFEQQSMSPDYYVMHDLMHDLARNVSKGECCRVEPNGKADIIPSTARHVSVHECDVERIFNLRNLRTLKIASSEAHVNIGHYVLPNGALKKTLRLLIIEGSSRCKLPEEIGCLIHLRFLKVYVGFVVQSYRYLLRNSIYKLHHLQVLSLLGGNFHSDYEDVETTGMINLVSLRYMKLPNQIMQNIHGVHRLTSLRKLNFCVGLESGHHIDELERLNNLRSLSIQTIENVVDPTKAMKTNLYKKESLISLSLNWTEGSDSDHSEHIIDNLRPHPNLKKLTIKYYSGHRCPHWMRNASHIYLSSLTIFNCPLWEALPFLGQLPNLKVLSLDQMDELKQVDSSSDGTNDFGFPSLELLYCNNMPKWESWGEPHYCYAFPKLKELMVRNCPSLVKLPAIPFSLFKFEVTNVGLDSLPSMYHCSSIAAPELSSTKSSLKAIKITDCPNLISLNGFLQQENLDLQAIEELSIENCKNLVQLPVEGFGKLMSLKSLTIRNSPDLVAMNCQRNLLPVKLQILTFGNCGELDVPLLEKSFGLTNLTQLQITRSENITSINSENAYISLERLDIMHCHKLVKFSVIVNQGNNLSLKMNRLEITDCPNLTELPNLPLPLNYFTIDNVAVSDLPEYFQSSSSSGSMSSSSKASLRDVKIYRCSNLTSLNGFLQQENIDLWGLEKLTIEECENLVQLPTGAFGKFGSLKALVIKGSPKLVTIDNQQILLPRNLESFEMEDCGELNVPLLESASELTALDNLYIGKCANITCMPSTENAFKWLSRLQICGCDKLVELSLMQQAHTANPVNTLISLNISYLFLDHLCLLLIEPLRHLRFVSYLEVRTCSGMEALPEQWLLQNRRTLKTLIIHGATSLRSLPGTMVMLTVLEQLHIMNATALEEMPELPPSLICKTINRLCF